MTASAPRNGDESAGEIRPPAVLTLGETMMVFNGPAAAPLDRGSAVQCSIAGAESNLAIGLARLGHRVRWISAVGDDLFGRIIVRTLRGEGVDVSQVQVSARGPTGVMFKNRRAYAEPEVLYYRAHSAFSQLPAEAVPPESWRGSRVLFLTGITPALGEGPRELCRQAAREARQQGAAVWLDPNYRRKLWTEAESRVVLSELLPLVNVVLAGVDEAAILTGQSSPEKSAAALLEAGVQEVVLKAGDQGAWYYRGGEVRHEPPFPLRRLVDPIGAGDGFDAGFLAGYLEGLPVDQRLRQASAIGAIVCQVEGDWEGLPRKEELDRFLEQNTESER